MEREPTLEDILPDLDAETKLKLEQYIDKVAKDALHKFLDGMLNDKEAERKRKTDI